MNHSPPPLEKQSEDLSLILTNCEVQIPKMFSFLFISGLKQLSSGYMSTIGVCAANLHFRMDLENVCFKMIENIFYINKVWIILEQFVMTWFLH